MSSGWIGVDLDGTLAHYTTFQGSTHIGPPIMPMVERVQEWVAAGEDVRIVTARANAAAYENQAAYADVIHAIQDWCATHIGRALPVTCCKDFKMIELWDDRCVQVVPNEGVPSIERHYETGFMDGEKQGYQAGYNEGYNEGFEKAREMHEPNRSSIEQGRIVNQDGDYGT